MARQHSQLRDSLFGIATRLRSAFSVTVSEQASDIFMITYYVIFPNTFLIAWCCNLYISGESIIIKTHVYIRTFSSSAIKKEFTLSK
jgi:hypothetical protein